MNAVMGKVISWYKWMAHLRRKWWQMMDSRWCATKFLCRGVGTYPMRGVSIRGDRKWSLDCALPDFLRLRVGMHSMHGLGGRGSRWQCLDNALRSLPCPPRLRYIPTPGAKKLRNAQPKHHHRLPQRTRLRFWCVPTPRCRKWRRVPPRLCHRLPWPPRPRMECIPTPIDVKKLRSAPPRLHHRPPQGPIDHALDAFNYR